MEAGSVSSSESCPSFCCPVDPHRRACLLNEGQVLSSDAAGAGDEVVYRMVLGPICRTQNIPAFAHGCPKPVMFWDFNDCR